MVLAIGTCHRPRAFVLPLCLWISLVCAAQLPLNDSPINPPTPLSAGPRPASPNIPPLLDDAFDRWLSETTSFWGLKGVSIAVVRCDNSAEENEESWFVETKGYGLKNAAGDPVTENVSSLLKVF
ncbi:hypothetical protein DL93DRAFT_2075223 [Clavulina sp. PMI_390]|nr:hypothetical protein DL93DRAFT_2075223 [Clavulina sp. PMI_390]